MPYWGLTQLTLDIWYSRNQLPQGDLFRARKGSGSWLNTEGWFQSHPELQKESRLVQELQSINQVILNKPHPINSKGLGNTLYLEKLSL